MMVDVCCSIANVNYRNSLFSFSFFLGRFCHSWECEDTYLYNKHSISVNLLMKHNQFQIQACAFSEGLMQRKTSLWEQLENRMIIHVFLSHLPMKKERKTTESLSRRIFFLSCLKHASCHLICLWIDDQIITTNSTKSFCSFVLWLKACVVHKWPSFLQNHI